MKSNELVSKAQQRSKSERHNAFTEKDLVSEKEEIKCNNIIK